VSLVLKRTDVAVAGTLVMVFVMVYTQTIRATGLASWARPLTIAERGRDEEEPH